ncbi:DUF3341 domain-containing protein [bacterium]|nr:DUF3341 domain-containing protein [bacterium]NUN46382.1 DUF3341 domain-containing protein [bacterium]HMV27180.1 DUF3341 domain-containing protein [bacterium]HMW33057.1 DUF3341 domain-containing protein [bacterium]HMZ04923.1 DUF3341 domain-containing protein [bacterium]
MSASKEKQTDEVAIVLAEFDGPATLIEAAKKMRDAGYKAFDCHSPFPVHGMDQAMGLARSPLAKICFVIAMSAVLGMAYFTYWLSFDYKLVISGKPLFSYVAYVPPVYAVGILTCALTAVVGMMVLNGLPQPYHPLFNSDNFARVTQDGFFVSVESTDPQYDEAKVKSLLASLGGTNVEVVKG